MEMPGSPQSQKVRGCGNIVSLTQGDPRRATVSVGAVKFTNRPTLRVSFLFSMDNQEVPTPSVVWTFKETPLKTDNNVTKDNIPNTSTLMLGKTKRVQSRTSAVVATTMQGKDTSTVEITILGKPPKPQGTLGVSDVNADGCKLKWDKPQEGSGELIQNYVIEKMDVESKRWVPLTTSKEPEAKLTGFVPGKKYKFSAKAVNVKGNSEPLETEKDTLAKNHVNVAVRPKKPSLVSATKHAVEISWTPPASDGGSPATSYIVEKKPKTGTEWQKAAETDDDKCLAHGGDLIAGCDYEFRVRAVKQAGSSLSFANDLAGGPGQLKVADFGTDLVSLKWSPLATDRGNPITKYVFGAKGKGKDGKFKPIHTTSDARPPAIVTGLPEGAVMEFRVRAVKLVGPGTPSKSTGLVTTKHKDLAPSIDRKTLKKMEVKAGRSLTLEVDVHGASAPTVEWTLNKTAIKETPNLKIENVPYHTTFEMVNAVRGQSGVYTFTATNSWGVDTADVEITIVSKPLAPKGPLKVSDVHEEGCALKWHEPDDDGGLPIEYYEIEKIERGTDQWFLAGKSMQPQFKVMNLSPGEKYKFRVRAVNREGDSDDLTTDLGIVAMNPLDKLRKPGHPKPIDWDLQWTAPRDENERILTSFFIEKRKMGTPKWTTSVKVNGTVVMGLWPEFEESGQYAFRVVPRCFVSMIEYQRTLDLSLLTLDMNVTTLTSIKLEQLPDDAMVYIFSFLSVMQLCELEQLSKRFQKVVPIAFKILRRFEFAFNDERRAFELGFNWLSYTILRCGGNLRKLRTRREIDLLQLDNGLFIGKLARTCPNIEKIKVYCTHADDCPSGIFLVYAKALQAEICKLTHLNFNDKSVSNWRIAGQRRTLLSRCPLLKSLKLCRWLRPLRQLLSAADGSKLQFNLEKIEFSRYATATPAGIIDLINHSPALRKITFEARDIGGHGFPGEPKKAKVCLDAIEERLIGLGANWSVCTDCFDSTVFTRSFKSEEDE